MGTNYKFADSQKSSRRGQIHPAMRGIGCLLMVVVPVFSYLLGDYLAGRNFGIQIIPVSWYGRMVFPDWAYRLSGLNFIANFFSSVPHLAANLAIAAAAIVLIGGIMAVIWGYAYSLLTPSKYGPYDVPPPRVKTKKYRR